MAVIDDIAQKVKGKGQKLKGRMNQDRIQGTIDEIKGEFNDTIADAKLQSRKERKRSTDY